MQEENIIATKSSSNLQWFALQARSRHENVVAGLLRSKGFEAFSPVSHLRRSRDRISKNLPEPLFPGYVFSRFDPRYRMPVLTTPGVYFVVGQGKTPIAIPDEEVEAIQKVVQSSLPVRPWPCLHVGQFVSIDRGPLAGISGVLVKMKNCSRIVLSVNLIERAVAVEVDEDMVSVSRNSPKVLAAGCGL